MKKHRWPVIFSSLLITSLLAYSGCTSTPEQEETQETAYPALPSVVPPENVDAQTAQPYKEEPLAPLSVQKTDIPPELQPTVGRDSAAKHFTKKYSKKKASKKVAKKSKKTSKKIAKKTKKKAKKKTVVQKTK
ncbi:MAG: hypothetical protein V4736_07760 [Bdellovibrionota bacterium]